MNPGFDVSGLSGLMDRAAEKHASTLTRIGLSRDQVKALAAAARPLTSEEIRIATIKSLKGRCGRRGLPADAVAAMYQDYQAMGSLAKVGKRYGRTRQSVYDLFKGRRLEMNVRKFYRKILFNDRFYTPGKGGWYRATEGNRESLAVSVWRTIGKGELPAGFQFRYLDRNPANCLPENLAIEARTSVLEKHRKGINGASPAHLKAKPHKKGRKFAPWREPLAKVL